MRMIPRWSLVVLLGFIVSPVVLAAQDPAYLTVNPYLGSPISLYDTRVSPYAPDGARNQFSTGGGQIYAQDGTYLGRLNANRYDPESVANPYGYYGSRYSSTSINNPYSTYGSRYSPLSPNNPYTATPPVVVYPAPSSFQSVPSWPTLP